MEKQNIKTVLVVEDEKSIRDAIIDVLHRKNFLSIEARNGKEGVTLALRKHPDIVLLDLLMPVMDGMTALKAIRADDWGAHVPVIILTNLSGNNEQLVDDVVMHKPINYLIKSDWKLNDIINKIEKVLEL